MLRRGHEQSDVLPQVRHIGVSNETSYGVMRFVQLAEQLGLPKIVSIQNSYSLLVCCRLGVIWKCMHGLRPLQPSLQCWPCTQRTITQTLALLT